MISTLRGYIVGVMVTFCLCATLSQAQPEGKDCSYLVANHSYANQFNGFINVPMFFGPYAPPGLGMAPHAGAGTITFFPNGTAKNVETLAIGGIGLFQDVEVSGPYTLTWDTSKTPIVCTGTLIMQGLMNGSPVEDDFQLVVSPDGGLLEMVHTNPGLIVGATSPPMDSFGCRNSTIGAKFSYNAQGWGLAPPGFIPIPPGLELTDFTLAGYIPFVMSGVMSFRPGVDPHAEFADAPPGSALVEAWDTPSIAGLIMPRTMTGWYKVNSKCRGTLFLHDSLGYDFHLEMFIGKGGSAIYLANIDTTPGTNIPAWLVGFTLNRLNNNDNRPADDRFEH